MLVVIEHAQHAPALGVERPGQRTALTARSMTKRVLPVADATCWQEATMTRDTWLSGG